MAQYYLAPYVGTGSDTDPFRPQSSGLDFHSIDLRPNPLVAEGFCLLRLPVVINDPALRDLGNDLSRLPVPVKNRIESALGVTLVSNRLDLAIAELLIDHARVDGSRWRPLQPTGSRYEVWFGGLIYSQPVQSGGSSFTESFNQADSTTLGPDLTWTETANDLQTVGNRCRVVTTTNATVEARAESDLATNDNYAQFTVVTMNNAAANENAASACCRFQSGARTHYMSRVIITTTGGITRILARRVAGTSANITSDTGAFVAGDILRCEAQGSTIRYRRNGVGIFSSTDTNIATGLRGGLSLTSNTNAGDVEVDTFEMGDLLSLQAAPRKYLRGVFHGVSQGVA